MARNKRKAFDVISVRTIEFEDTVLTVCRERNDSWAHSVLARISSAHDLHAADAIYHKACDINFRTMRQSKARLSRRAGQDRSIFGSSKFSRRK